MNIKLIEQITEENTLLKEKNERLRKRLNDQFFSNLVHDMSEIQVGKLVDELKSHPIFQKASNNLNDI